MLQITDKNIRKTLQRLMTETGYTASQLKNDAGVSIRTAYLQNDNPTLKTLCKILDAMGYEVVIRRTE